MQFHPLAVIDVPNKEGHGLKEEGIEGVREVTSSLRVSLLCRSEECFVVEENTVMDILLKLQLHANLQKGSRRKDS